MTGGIVGQPRQPGSASLEGAIRLFVERFQKGFDGSSCPGYQSSQRASRYLGMVGAARVAMCPRLVRIMWLPR
jgi:hypothetical protein